MRPDDVQPPRRLRDVPVRLDEGLLEELSLEGARGLLEGFGRCFLLATRSTGKHVVRCHRFRPLSARADCSRLECVFELPNVAGPLSGTDSRERTLTHG